MAKKSTTQIRVLADENARLRGMVHELAEQRDFALARAAQLAAEASANHTQSQVEAINGEGSPE